MTCSIYNWAMPKNKEMIYGFVTRTQDTNIRTDGFIKHSVAAYIDSYLVSATNHVEVLMLNGAFHSQRKLIETL